jgi:uncharacterized protein (DUF488 family)
MGNTLFTIGHSTHSAETFLRLLTMNGISAVADVRSRPYSRVNPQFNRETLKADINAAGIAYVFLGLELGARTDDRSCYENGKVQYARLARTPLFQSGLRRVIDGSAIHRIALMCAEKDPITCHRMVLVCHELRREPLDTFHIRSDGSLEANADAELRMVRAVALPESDLFTSGDQAVEEAYRRQGERIAWVDHEDARGPATNTLTNVEASL